MIEKLMTATSEIIERIEMEGQDPIQGKSVLLDELKKIYGDEATERLEQIRDFFVRTDDNHREIIEGKAKGQSSDAWLKARLASKEQEFPGLTKGIIQGFQDLSGEDDQKHLHALDESNPFDFNILSHNVKEGVVLSTLSEVVNIDETMETVLEKRLPEPYVRLVRSLKSDMNSEEDREMKELLTVGALKFVRDADENSSLKKLDHIRTSAIVDAAYTTSKIAYKIADNSMTSDEAIEFVIDRGVARLESLVGSACTKLGGKVGAGIGRMIGSVFGPAGMILGDKVGGVIGALAGRKIGDAISTGARKMSTLAKEGVRNLVQGAKSMVRDGVKSFVSKFF